MNYYLAKYGFEKASYLCHHGILGQKWGIRRFQNKDGSLTKAGRDRYITNSSNDNQDLKSTIKRIKNGNSSSEDFDNCLRVLSSINKEPGVSVILDDSRKQSANLDKAYKQWEANINSASGMDAITEAWHQYVSKNPKLSEMENRIFDNQTPYTKAVSNSVYSKSNDREAADFMQTFARDHYFDYIFE